MADTNTNTDTNATVFQSTHHVPTIAEILRNKDLELKKVNKDATTILGVTTVVDLKKLPKELVQTSATFQSVYDKMGHVTKLVSQLRKANIATMTETCNFFTKKQVNVVDCRQHMVGDVNKGLESEVYFLRKLYNHGVQQANSVKASIDAHNKLMQKNIDRDLYEEDSAHERERKKLIERKMPIPVDFESKHAEKRVEMTETFWKENKATQIDPLNIFLFLSELKEWLDDHEKNREMRLNRANHGPIGDYSNLYKVPKEPTISLEELMSYVKEYNAKIETAFHKLILVSWKVGNGDSKNFDIVYASDRLNEMKTLIQTYGTMQSVQTIVTDLTPVGIMNPLNNEPMTATDAVDFKNIVVPVFTKMLKTIETQQNEANAFVKSREPECRTKAMEVLKDSMSAAASARPSPEQLKELTTSIMDATMPKISIAEGLEVWLGKYQSVLDSVDSTMDTALATVNANTRVEVTWTNVVTPVVVGTWDQPGQINMLPQPNKSGSHTTSHTNRSASSW